MSKKINFAPIDASDAKGLHDLQNKLFPAELTESVEEIEAILSNADQLFNCNHSFAVYDNLKMIGYVFAYVDSKSIFYNRDEEVFYIKELGILPGYERYLRYILYKLANIWLTYTPQLAAEAHAIEEAKNKWKRLPKIQQQFETTLKIRESDEKKGKQAEDYFILRWEANLSGRAARSYSLPSKGWEYRTDILVNVISDVSRLEVLRKDWDNLLGNTVGGNFLSSLDFVQAWWKYFGTWQDLYVIIIRHNDEVIGIAPLMKECWGRGGRFEQELSIIGEPNFVVAPQLLFAKNEGLCLSAMMGFLREKENASTWQRLVLAKQRSTIFPTQLSTCVSGSPYGSSITTSAIKILHLGNNFQHFVEKKLLVKTAYNSLLELQKSYEYIACSVVDSSQEVINILSGIEEDVAEDKRQVNQGENYYFFYSAIVELLAREKTLRWYVFRKDDKAIASCLGLVESNVFYVLMQNYRDDCPAGIDESLLLLAIKELIAKGITYLVFVDQDLVEKKSLYIFDDESLTSVTIKLKTTLIDRVKLGLKNISRR